jgi:hypothetical protein
MQYALALNNQRLDLVEQFGGPTPVLRVYSGPAPATCELTATGTLLAAMALPSDWMMPAFAGQKAKSGSWEDVQANATGGPGYFRFYMADGVTCFMQGSAGVGNTDMLLSEALLLAGRQFTVLGFTIGAGNR